LDITTAGKQIGTLPVFIGYRIIDLFSGHLYSNPAKAIEELVVNAYDAFAQNCQVILPDDWENPDAKVLVWDDGESMNLEGLRELWLVAETTKRDPNRERRAEKKGRLPIGKFGIGKLASYVVGHRISHVCKHGKQILAVTMDFSEVIPDELAPGTKRLERPKEVTLSVRELQDVEAKGLLDFAVSGGPPGGVALPLFGNGAPKSWTLVIVDHLKTEAKAISRGRLRWIISTALPLVPDFHVFLDGQEVPPSKLSKKSLKKWQVGKKDKVANDLDYKAGEDPHELEPFDSWISIPGVGKVSGELTLYEETLLGGKSEETGRSHGFFIMVRRRLVNHDDPLFGIHVLSHATFNRLRAIIHVNDLDRELVASRESVSEEKRLILEKYLVAKFNEIRNWYQEYLAERDKKEGIEDRLAAIPGPLARFPMKHAVDRALHDKGLTPITIQVPPEGKTVVDTIKKTEFATLDQTDPLAVFDASTGTVKINVNHPFYVNYADFQGMEAIGTAEVLLVAYLYESSLAPNEVRELLERRDQFLRFLVREKPRSVMIIAEQIRESVASESGLEEASHSAFRALGFEVLPLGGSGKPDGLATAVLAVRYGDQTGKLETRSYSVTYDAKSTGHEKVKSGDIRMSTVDRHRDDYKADYAAVIGSDFETTTLGEKSKAVKEAKKANVTLIRARDFARLVEASGVKPLSLSELENLFETCRSPEEAHGWISKFCSDQRTLPDIGAMLERIYKLQKEHPADPPSIGAIKHSPKVGEPLDAPEWQIKDWLYALSRLLPGLIFVYGDRVELNSKPEIVIYRFQQSLQRITKKSTSQESP